MKNAFRTASISIKKKNFNEKKKRKNKVTKL